MFSNPQCPICGKAFASVNAVIGHIDRRECVPDLLNLSPLFQEPEGRDMVSGYESDDPTTINVEDAG
jgi:hypothetical protein